MIVQRYNKERAKLANAIMYFARNVKYHSKMKIYKLLYHLDFTHFKEIGRSVTGLDYYAWRWGPVPAELHAELEGQTTLPGYDKAFKIITEVWDDLEDKKSFIFKALKRPDLNVFTPREQKILDNLVLIYKDVTASQMSEMSHSKKQPWDITMKTHGEKSKIEYMLALNDKDAAIDEVQAQENLKIKSELDELFPIEPD